MSGIRLNGRAYGGVATVANADHLMCEDGSGNVINAQTLLNRILGDFATVEISSTASKAYAIGDYLVLNGQLYKVTAAIAAEDTITPGTNVVATNVQDAIDEKYEKPSGGIPKTDLASAVQTSLGKADTALQITDIAGCTFYKTIGTHFAELVKNSGDMAIIYAQRLSVDSCAIYAVHNYNGTIHAKEVFNSGLFSITTNSVGTVSILYNNDALNVYAVAIKY